MAESSTPRHDGGPGGKRRGEAPQPNEPDDDAEATAHVDDWVGRLRADAASQLRRREHWLRRQAADDASLSGVLVDHAEQGTTVAVTTVGGGHHVGRVRGAGAEVVVLHTDARQVIVALDAVETVRAQPGGHAHVDRSPVNPVGHRVGDDPTTLADLLSHAAGDRPDVVLVTRSGDVVGGELVSVGRDVVLVRPTDRTPLVYARLSSVSEASLPLSTRSG